MQLPRVRVDLRNHPHYSTNEHHKFLAKIFDAEILMLNVNKGTMRVRVYDVDTGELVTGNFDMDMSYIVDDSLTIHFNR